MSRKGMAVVLSLVLAFADWASAEPQEDSSGQDSPPPGWRIHRSVPPEGAATHVVVPGERFRAGSFKRWLYGGDYRDLWTTPIEVEVLDLGSVGGGLRPLRAGGFGQSISLHFTGEDGRRYTVRSLDKDPTRRIWDDLKDTIADDLLQDLTSALLPTGALVSDPLMEATGILHSRHTLVVIPGRSQAGGVPRGVRRSHRNAAGTPFGRTGRFARLCRFSQDQRHGEAVGAHGEDPLQPCRCPRLPESQADGLPHRRQGPPLRPVEVGAVSGRGLPHLGCGTGGPRPGFHRPRRVRHGRSAQRAAKADRVWRVLSEPGGADDYGLGDGPRVPRRAGQGRMGLGGGGVPRPPA